MEMGKLFGWGQNSCGQLGRSSSEHNGTSHLSVPSSVHILSGFDEDEENQPEIVSMASGVEHSIVLSANGKVYSAGSNDYGQVGPISDPLLFFFKWFPPLLLFLLIN